MSILNYNIMNIILDKKAFTEWHDRIVNIHKEFDEKYYIYIDDFVMNGIKSINFNEDYIGEFCYISYKEGHYCEYCNSVYLFGVNSRDSIGPYNIADGYITNVYQHKCSICRGIKLPINYM